MLSGQINMFFEKSRIGAVEVNYWEATFSQIRSIFFTYPTLEM
jgi:hypothetical protein